MRKISKVVEKLIIQNVSLAVNKNQIVGLLGPNGAGKTSTFYAIAGIVKIDSGKILFKKMKFITFQYISVPITG